MPFHDDPHRKYTEATLPLAGLHPCLTFQLNATYHRDSDSLKWVLAVREPNEKVEIARYSGPMQAWEGGLPSMMADIEHAVFDLSSLRRTGQEPPLKVLRTQAG